MDRSRHGHGGQAGRDQGPGRVVPDSTAAVSEAAQQEARKGTAAAADPVIGITPEGQALPGTIVDGEFVASVDHLQTTVSAGEHAEESVAACALPGENEKSKHLWWIRRRPRSSRD